MFDWVLRMEVIPAGAVRLQHTAAQVVKQEAVIASAAGLTVLVTELGPQLQVATAAAQRVALVVHLVRVTGVARDSCRHNTETC